ncbi:glycosyltransferase [uncultured Clostridium sp.]|uniref:CgeB family protein n=1 Tax=uncultured Clostridium sp. TaxID=59620 RepID=UPI0028E477D9|nr:glycosyltransferase [uncultured Clostridium sp.]
MKILFVEDAPLIKYGIGYSLEQYGIEVKYTKIYIDVENGILDTLEEEIKSFRPDAIFNAGMCIYKNAKKFLEKIKELKVPYIYWAIEDPLYYRHISLPHAKASDLTMTTAIECLEPYKKIGVNAIFFMFGCNENFHNVGIYNKKFDHDIIFIGNNYSNHKARQYGNKTVLNPLIERDYDIKIFGNDWWFEENNGFKLDRKYYGGYCDYEEIKDAYSTAKIVLGLHSVDNSSTMMSMRTFEVLGCGGFYLSQYVPSLERYFVNKEHLVWSRNSNETLKNVDYYLKNPQERNKIASNGQKICYKEHSYKDKIPKLIKELKNLNVWRD